MEAPERESSPRWPTNITEITWRAYRRRLDAIRGPASHNCFFTSAETSLLPFSTTPPLSPSAEPRTRGELKLGLSIITS
ncbi:hypothetical protein AXF42_Ash015272 [Apostasia shenzhenica]|uniref:Uncharacterized protein n=1 Tax=Apostasia shenzhenica TaxID=1088818 RepID=A0A2I0ALS0_9ASPA|nr:hypothetical protein AXF42_Ash015272 [Apostasia shenzhenica]